MKPDVENICKNVLKNMAKSLLGSNLGQNKEAIEAAKSVLPPHLHNFLVTHYNAAINVMDVDSDDEVIVDRLNPNGIGRE